VKPAIIAHLQTLKQLRIQESISALQVTIVQKEVAFLLPAQLVHIPQVSVLHLPPIALLAQQVKFVVEAVLNLARLFAMLAIIAPWVLKIAL
jgi:hypothetical protein